MTRLVHDKSKRQVKITASDIAKITGGHLSGVPGNVVNELLTDSRGASFTEGQAFFAIRGVNHDGHNFIPQLYDRGIRIFIAERLPDSADEWPGASFIIVNDTVDALQLLAAHKRRLFGGRVIAITGSAGKTIVKEWLADVAGKVRQVVRSPKSYNSQIGVPLSVWKLDEGFDMAIIEAGISLPGEMEKLRNVIDPHTGVITNIGDAHSENFSDLESKASEKLKLFRNCSVIVWCSDYKIIDQLIRTDSDMMRKNLFDWSAENSNAALFLDETVISDGKSVLKVIYGGTRYEFSIPFTDRASIENAITVAAVCLAEGLDIDSIRKGLSRLVSVAMRMEIKTGVNGCQLIEDYYNSDPGSLGMALEYLRTQNKRKTVLILSDFIQSGRDEKDLYSEVARLVKRVGIGRFIGIGKALSSSRDLFPAGSSFYNTTDEFINILLPSWFTDEVILLKGARIFEFEKISQVLEHQVHQTVLEINLDAITNNLNEFRKKLNQGTRIMAMVKAFAYGAGPSEIAALLEYHRIDYLAVAYADEGVELRKAGVTVPVVVMNPESSAFGVMIKYNLEPEIYSLNLLKGFIATASRHGLVKYPVHIKIDTGMHRLGFMPGETGQMLDMIRSSESVRVMSVFSHMAASESAEFDDFTKRQASIFIEISDLIRKTLGYGFLRHILNSSGIARFPEYQFEMVRPGIGLYGVRTASGLDLRPAGRYISRISQIKRIPAGEPVGYGCADRSEKERIIAILPVGYADGLDRKLGNRNGNLYINGRRVSIIGNVCMDMCMADVTGTGAKEGDEAEIFGLNITVEEMAEKCGTIPYEILTSIPARVKRVFHRG
jgi:Alr-MurF fusion protein